MVTNQSKASADPLAAGECIGASEIIVGLLSKLTQLLRSSMWHHCKHRNLTPTQLRTLLFVAQASSGQCTLSALARSEGVTLPTAAGIINALVHRQLVRREPNPSDRRSILLKLTSEGERIRHEMDVWEANIRRIVEALPHERQDALLQALRELIASLRRIGGSTFARVCYTCQYCCTTIGAGDVVEYCCSLLNHPLSIRDILLDCPHFVPQTSN